VVVLDLVVASGWNLKDSVVVLFQSKNVSGYYFVTKMLNVCENEDTE